jgi:diguanylate cyclase (GGDEF)-like protein/PAS domain S-box-containing protein
VRAPKPQRPEDLVAALSAETGEAFFAALTGYVSRELGVDFVFVGELIGPAREAVRTRSFHARGRQRDHFEYRLEHTPCQTVVHEGFCTYAGGVARLFPRDRHLREYGIESYCGVALRSEAGSPLGILVVMDSAPFADPRRIESLLSLFAPRASAELARLHADGALRAAEARERLLLAEMPAILWSTDRELRFTSSLGAGLARLGLRPNEVVGRTLEEFFGPDGAEPALAAHRAALEGGVSHFEFDRSGIAFQVSVRPLFGAAREIEGAIGSAFDISDLRAAQRTLAESEAGFRAQYMANPLATFTWRRAQDDFVLSAFNDAARAMTGGAIERLRGARASELYADEPEIPAEMRACITKQGVRRREMRYRLRSTGEWKELAVTYAFAPPDFIVVYTEDIAERRRAEEVLRERLAFERLIATISTRFINVDVDNLDDEINAALRDIGAFLGVDRAYLFRFEDDNRQFTNTHEWCREGIAPARARLSHRPVESFPWIMRKYLAGEVVYLNSLSELPPEAAAERREFALEDIRSLATVPVSLAGRVLGIVGLDSVREEKRWNEDAVALLRIVGEVFANAFMRRDATQRLRELNRLVATIAEINRALVRETTRAGILQETCRIMVEHGGYRLVWVGMADRESGRVSPVAMAGRDAEKLHVVQVRCDDTPEGRGSVGEALRSGRPAVIDDTETDERFGPWREWARRLGFRAVAAMPLAVRGEIIGTVAVYADRPHFFRHDEIGLLGRLMDNVGHALQTLEDAEEHRRAEAALRESEQRFRLLFRANPLSISISRVHEGSIAFLDVNEGFTRVTGWAREEALGRSSVDLGLWPEASERDRLLAELRSQGALRDIEWRMVSRSGEVRDLLGSWERLRIGDEDCVMVVAQDVTERKRAEHSMGKLSSALESTADSVVITGRDGIIEYVNPAFERTTGYSRAEALGRKPSILKSGRQPPEFYRRLWETILSGEVFSDVFVNKKKDGSLFYDEKTITPLRDAAGEITHFVATGRDISERLRTQERLQYLAYHDVLTELPNRALFMDRLEHALSRAPRGEHRLAVLFLDVDRFKVINDTLGHDVGDRLLQHLAGRLTQCVREGDTVARVSGDEFAVLLEDLESTEEAVTVARKLLEAFAKPFDVNGRELFVTTSIGVSSYPADGQDARTLLKCADTAMYRAKDAGRNNYQFYSADMSARAVELLTLETGLRRALEREEFVLHYQPIFDLKSGRLVAAEALLRWRHPELGLVLPGDFVPLLEETGLIVPVGEWVLDAAGAQAQAWAEQHGVRRRLSVNLSARQFHDAGLAARIQRLITDRRLGHGELELEITESILMRSAPDALATLSRLADMGCRIAIDDFGTGYSSLAYLRRFPIHTLKIDRSFVRDVPGSGDASSIVRTIVAMAHGLKLEVVAEGVETEAQAAFVRACGCDLAQGYFLGRPAPSEEFARLLAPA